MVPYGKITLDLTYPNFSFSKTVKNLKHNVINKPIDCLLNIFLKFEYYYISDKLIALFVNISYVMIIVYTIIKKLLTDQN